MTDDDGYARIAAQFSLLQGEVISERARAEKAEAEVERLKGAIHADIIADTHYCERHEMMYQRGHEAPPKCPHCECEALEAALDWYANVAHYVHGPNGEESDASEDSGTRARAALKGIAS